MSIDTHHEEYDKWLYKWRKCRDVISGGQEAVHAAGELYLPRFKDESDTDYEARKGRAVFYEASGRAVEGMKGMLFRKSPKITVSNEDLLVNVNTTGKSFLELLMEGAQEALEINRFGILVDYPVVQDASVAADVAGILPSMNIYKVESIINWETINVNGRAVLSLVVLVEGENYRVLDLTEEGIYRVRIFDDKLEQVGSDIFPKMNGKQLTDIPFEFYPSVGISKPPLLGMVNMNLAHYLTTADYEHGCHLSGLPTMFITGHTPKEGDSIYIGGPTAKVLPEEEAKAFYVEIKSDFAALKDNMEAKEVKMAVLGARMLEAQKKQVETSEVASIHRAGEGATLATIGLLLSKVFTRSLKLYAEWAGENPTDVTVGLNKDFIPFGISPQLIASLLQAVQLGEMSSEAFFDNLKQGEMYPETVNYEQEQERIGQQPPPAPDGI